MTTKKDLLNELKLIRGTLALLLEYIERIVTSRYQLKEELKKGIK